MTSKFRPRSTRSTPSFDSGIIEEPLLLFGGRKEHVDPKTGLTLFGPYTPTGQTRPTLSSITVGLVGPGAMIADAGQWLEALRGTLTNEGTQPFLYPHFPGFNKELPFQCELVHGDTWNEPVKGSELTAALSLPNMSDRINKVIEIYIRAIQTLSQREPKPSIIVLCLPQEVVESCMAKIKGPMGAKLPIKQLKKKLQTKRPDDSPQLSMLDLLGEDPADVSEVWEYENLRRGLKAESMRFGIPTQIVWPRAIELTNQTGGRGTKKSQDIATRAWNFTTALYHKAGGSPWRLSNLAPGVCYVSNPT